MPWGYVYNEPIEQAIGYTLQMIAYGIDMPIAPERLGRLDDRPCPTHERSEVPTIGLALYRMRQVKDFLLGHVSSSSTRQ
jgi:hypothetical protein